MIDRSFDTHHLINLMKNLGYPDIDEGGICAGVTAMFLQAATAKKLPELINRLTLIEKTVDTLATQFKEIEEKIKNHISLTKKEKEILDLRAFLDNLALHQNPDNYQDLLGSFVHPTSRHTENLSSYTEPASITENPARTIKEIFSCPGIFSLKELEDFFRSMQAMAATAKKDFSLVFTSIRHRVLSYYDSTEEKFYFFDPNKLSFISSEPHHLPEKLLRAFHPFPEEENLDYESLAFETTIFAAAEDAASLKELMAKSVDIKTNVQEIKTTDYFYPLFTIDAEKAERIGSDGFSLLWIAAQNNHADSVAELINDYKVEPNPKFMDEEGNYTDLVSVVINAHFIEVLAKIIPHLTMESKIEALTDAAKAGNLEAVKLLLKSGVAADAKNSEGKTAIREARDAKQGPVLEWLQTHSSSSKSRLDRLGVGIFSAPIPAEIVKPAANDPLFTATASSSKQTK